MKTCLKKFFIFGVRGLRYDSFISPVHRCPIYIINLCSIFIKIVLFYGIKFYVSTLIQMCFWYNGNKQKLVAVHIQSVHSDKVTVRMHACEEKEVGKQGGQ